MDFDLILQVLDIQYQTIWSTRIGEQRNVQFAYYNGMKLIADMVTEGHIQIDMSGKHYISKEPEKEVGA